MMTRTEMEQRLSDVQAMVARREEAAIRHRVAMHNARATLLAGELAAYGLGSFFFGWGPALCVFVAHWIANMAWGINERVCDWLVRRYEG